MRAGLAEGVDVGILRIALRHQASAAIPESAIPVVQVQATPVVTLELVPRTVEIQETIAVEVDQDTPEVRTWVLHTGRRLRCG